MTIAYDIQDDHLLALWKTGDTITFTRFVERLRAAYCGGAGTGYLYRFIWHPPC